MEAFVLSTVLLFVDYGQTRYIAATPGWYETNLLLPEKPTIREVDTHFATAIVWNGVVGVSLPKQYRKAWWYAVAATEASFVLNNHKLGVKVNWSF